MHLHSHLVNCVLDYGPVHNFWQFSFERFNGILGDFKTNQRAVEMQLMRKFLRDQDIRDLPFPTLFRSQLGPVFRKMNNTSMDPLPDISLTLDLLSLSDGPVTKSDLWIDTSEDYVLVSLLTDWITWTRMNSIFFCVPTQPFLKGWTSHVEL